MLCGLELQRQKSYYNVLKTSRPGVGTTTAPAASEDPQGNPDKLPVVELRPFVSCVWERGKSYSNGFPDISASVPVSLPTATKRPESEVESQRLQVPPVGLITDLVIGSGSGPVRFESPRMRRTQTHPGPTWFTPETAVDNRHLGVMGRRLPWGSSNSSDDLKALYSRGGGSCVRKTNLDLQSRSRQGTRNPVMQPLPVHRINLIDDGANSSRSRRFDESVKRRWPYLGNSVDMKIRYGLKSETRGEMSLRRGKLANRKHYGRWLPRDGPQESLEGAMLTFGNGEDDDEDYRGAG